MASTRKVGPQDGLTAGQSQKDKAIKEIGDVFWYITLISDIVELDIEDIFTNKAVNNISIGDIAGDIKKFYRDNQPIDKDKLIENMSFIIEEMTVRYEQIFHEEIKQIYLDKIHYLVSEYKNFKVR